MKFTRCILSFMLLVSAIAMAREDNRPNIVFILMDDLGMNDTSFSGRQYHETPNIDRLAREGMSFTQAYANASECSPSRASIITGQYTPRTDIYVVKNPKLPTPEKATTPLRPVANNGGLMGDYVLMPQLLKKSGYATAFFGKWHHAPRPNSASVDWDEARTPWPNESDPMNDPKRAFTVTQLGIDFIRKNREKPFFLYLSHDAPHWPFESRPETLARFEAKKKNNAKDRADYAAMISDADTAIGLFLDSLEELGLAENTVIFFTSDNGGSMEYTINDPLRGGKGRPHEGGVRVPMIVRWPGNIPAGSTNDTAVIGTDLYPTFLSLAGVAKPDSLILDGADISPLLREEAIADRSIFWHCPAYNVFRTAPHSVIRHGNHKLIHWYENGESELFDLTEARPERNDLAAENPEAHNQLITKLNSWQKEIKAKEPAPNPNYKAAE